MPWPPVHATSGPDRNAGDPDTLAGCLLLSEWKQEAQRAWLLINTPKAALGNREFFLNKPSER
jgi:hypothetical protein